MKIKIFKTKKELAAAAAGRVATILKHAIRKKGNAVFAAAAGKSQTEFLKNLAKESSLDWSKITMFHLDEYIGLPKTHKASFHKYLKEKLIDKIHPGKVYLINNDNPKKEIKRLNILLAKKEIDIVFLGIGENGHIAFNDPPADFKTNKPYILVKLDDANKIQQVKQRWFSKLSDVPKQAISMSVKQIMKSKNIICLAFGKRKAKIIKRCFSGNVSPEHPASILKKHKNAFIYLDKSAAALLDRQIKRNLY